jgi:hypothetical protein
MAASTCAESDIKEIFTLSAAKTGYANMSDNMK